MAGNEIVSDTEGEVFRELWNAFKLLFTALIYNHHHCRRRSSSSWGERKTRQTLNWREK